MEYNPLKDIDKVFEKYAVEIEENVQDILSWTNNLKDEVKAEGDETGITISMPLYGWILDKGSKAHKITAVNAEALSFELNGERVFYKSVNHPGTKPKEWIMEAVNMDKLTTDILNKMSYNYTRWVEVTYNDGKFIAGRTPWNK